MKQNSFNGTRYIKPSETIFRTISKDFKISTLLSTQITFLHWLRLLEFLIFSTPYQQYNKKHYNQILID